MVRVPHGTSPASTVLLLLSARVVLLSFTLLRLMSTILLLLMLDAQGAFNFELTDTTTEVALDVIVIACHGLHGGITSRDTPV